MSKDKYNLDYNHNRIMDSYDSSKNWTQTQRLSLHLTTRSNTYNCLVFSSAILKPRGVVPQVLETGCEPVLLFIYSIIWFSIYSIVKILNLYIIILWTHLYLSSFQYLSITCSCNAFIACYIRRKKYSVINYLPRCTYHLL